MALNVGFTREIVMALGGWKSGRMIRRYAAVTDQTLRAAAEAVSGHESVVSRRRGGNRRSHQPAPNLREQLLDVDARVVRLEILRGEKTVVAPRFAARVSRSARTRTAWVTLRLVGFTARPRWPRMARAPSAIGGPRSPGPPGAESASEVAFIVPMRLALDLVIR